MPNIWYFNRSSIETSIFKCIKISLFYVTGYITWKVCHREKEISNDRDFHDRKHKDILINWLILKAFEPIKSYFMPRGLGIVFIVYVAIHRLSSNTGVIPLSIRRSAWLVMSSDSTIDLLKSARCVFDQDSRAIANRGRQSMRGRKRPHKLKK